jgi:hypothetical protein
MWREVHGAQDKLSGQLLLTFLGIMAGRAMQIYFSASAARTLVRGCIPFCPHT